MSDLSPVEQLYGNLSHIPSLQGVISLPESAPYYEDSIAVNPTFYRQEFQTEGMIMRDNVIVLPISYQEIPNEAGGVTVYIAKEESDGS